MEKIFIVYSIDNLSGKICFWIEGAFRKRQDAEACIDTCKHDILLEIDKGDFNSNFTDVKDSPDRLYNDKYYIAWYIEEQELF